MYVHLGEDILVRSRDIITILDKETVNTSQYIKDLLEQEKDQIVHLAKGTYKSIVITDKCIYYSPLASGTLKKRSTKLTEQEY